MLEERESPTVTDQPPSLRYPAPKFVLLGLALFVPLAGCQGTDHRISIDDFVAMQKAPPKPTPPSKEESTRRVSQAFTPLRVGPGDVLSVRMIGADGREIYSTLNARVDREGKISLPNIAPIRVKDMELEDVEGAIRAAYVPNVHREMVVHVEPVQFKTTDVLVVGAVTAPGLVSVTRTQRDMLHAIVGAGGVSDIASGVATLRRLRDPAKEETYNLTDPVQLQAALATDSLQDGDVIEVAATEPNNIYVGGLVLRAGAQPYPAGSGVTMLQALAAAGGVRTDVFPKEGTLIRHLPDGRDVQVKLNLDRLARGEDPNLTLAAGDILWVPETFGTRFMQFVNSNIFFRAGVSVNYNVSGVEYLNRQRQQAAGLAGRSSSLQDSFDPLGFLNRNTILNQLNTTTTGP